MGTETSITQLNHSNHLLQSVKKNNPLMGTETCNCFRGMIKDLHKVKKNNLLMGTKTAMTMWQNVLPRFWIG